MNYKISYVRITKQQNTKGPHTKKNAPAKTTPTDHKGYQDSNRLGEKNPGPPTPV